MSSLAGQIRNRFILIRMIVFIFFSILLFRLWYLQVVNGSHFRIKSENNRSRLVKSIAPRGIIYDRDGRPLVKNRPSFNIEIIPEDIEDLDLTLHKIAKILDLSFEEIKLNYSKNQRGRTYFEPKIVVADIDREQLAKIKVRSYDLPGVIVTNTPTREYPHRTAGAIVLGYSKEISKEQIATSKYRGAKQGDIVGQSGIEQSEDSYLRGEDGFIRVEVDAFGKRRKELGISESKPGSDIVTSLDLDLMLAAEKAMEGKKGAVVAIDPSNGDVLVLSSFPSYDANILSGRVNLKEWASINENPDRPLLNRAISSTYAPGSTFKLLMAAAGLQEKIVSPTSSVYCTGKYPFNGGVKRCNKISGHGPVDLSRAIIVSCNYFFYNLGKSLGVDKIHYYATAFGLGEKTLIPLEGEVGGLIPSQKWKAEKFKSKSHLRMDRWYEGETLSVAIGQGYVNATPLQMSVAISALVNGGKVYQPRLLKQIGNDNKKLFAERIVNQLPISPENLDTVKNIAIQVVGSKEGTGKKAAINGIAIGGKTGTAQTKNSGKTKVSKDSDDNAWFVSFAPAENPMIAMAIIVEGGGHGGSAAAPVSKAVMEKFFQKKGMISLSEEVEIKAAPVQEDFGTEEEDHHEDEAPPVNENGVIDMTEGVE